MPATALARSVKANSSVDEVIIGGSWIDEDAEQDSDQDVTDDEDFGGDDGYDA